MTQNVTLTDTPVSAEPEIRRDQFLKIWGFMLTDLRLEKTELIVYAVIFAIYNNYCDYFTGSRKYLMCWTRASKSAVDNSLASLEKKGYIIKEEKYYGRMKRAVYRINTEALPSCEMFALENRNRDINRKIREKNGE